MRAAVCHRLSDDRSGLIVEPDWPEPVPGPGEVRVRLAFAALNYPDLLMLAGGYQYAPTLPFVPGVEGCGIIDAVGDGIDRGRIGARVVVGARSGCFAEWIVVPAAAARAVPDGLDDGAAAALTVGALTAYVALVRRGRLVAGERLLVAGAGGGMGLAAVQLGVALGATVVAAASTPAKLDAAADAGATELICIDRRAPDYGALLAPVDVVFDPLGHAGLFDALADGGRYLAVGFVGGIARVAFDTVRDRRLEVIGVRAGEYARQDPAGGRANLDVVDALAAAGRLTPHIGLTVPLDRIDDASAAMARGTLVGKAVVALR